MTKNKTVLITGVSSGIGRETAQLLASKGFRVFGTVRKETRALPGVEYGIDRVLATLAVSRGQRGQVEPFETLRAGGDVWELPPQAIPDG